MSTEHPITPPPELVERLRGEAPHSIRDRDGGVTRERQLAIAAYRAGADQQLETLLAWLRVHHPLFDDLAVELRDAMRPKPLSLAEQALAQTNAILTDPNRALLIEVRETLELNRAALERLQQLEQENHD